MPPANPLSFISDRATHIDASGIRKVFDLAAKLKDPINLSIGQPDFDVPDPLKEAAANPIRAAKTKYTPTQVIAELINPLNLRVEADMGNNWADPAMLILSGTS